MMQTIAIIACGNGFGHVRRCVLIGEALIIRGVRVTLFAPTRALEKINRSVGVKDRFTTVDFDSSTSAEALRTGNPNSARWEHRLPPLDRFDLVLCDNLPEVLAVRPDAILSGNFLWHQALPDIAKEIRTRADSLLAAHRPTMITYGPFAAKELQNVTRCLPVALSQDRRDVTNAERRALLISCGHGLASRDETTCLIETVAEGPRPEVDMVFVEPDLLPDNAPVWMSPADYTHSMYDTLSGAVIRPGMGTVGDCLASGVRIFAFHEPGNLEMVNNSRQLAAIGVGENCLDSADAWTRATAYLDDRESQARHAKASTHLEFGGAIAAASHLVNYMQNNTFIY